MRIIPLYAVTGFFKEMICLLNQIIATKELQIDYRFKNKKIIGRFSTDL